MNTSFLRLSPVALAAGTAAASIVAVLLRLMFSWADPYGMHARYMQGPFPTPYVLQRPGAGVIFLAAIGAVVIAGVFGAIVAAVYNWTASKLSRA